MTVPAGAPASALAPAEGEPARGDTFATGVSILTLVLTTVFGPLQSFLKTTSLDVRQWLICLVVALSIVVVTEIRKAVVRWRTVSSHPITR